MPLASIPSRVKVSDACVVVHLNRGKGFVVEDGVAGVVRVEHEMKARGTGSEVRFCAHRNGAHI